MAILPKCSAPLHTLCLLAFAAASSACHKASDDDCERIARQMVTVALAETPHSEVGENAAENMRADLVTKCLESRPTQEQVTCLLSASDRAAIAGC